ncbi:DNA-binding transcriptional regulator, AcrR family [Catalinimonas alkaloidigena]|uniref:DNA-binding transcriptional regulator, AcrR family n=1 Tax=Catalinimonas alkaloidigena TaxID=1075417 RepID=A0A1G9HAH9_9BACT|nr:TetR/AcrR family transcriptional regulator [Catalinimonas alkaloidigena]SDL09936.1 DNA-binding transcriptional regulator, AcrR family [Catalinimonas alkaloidigena]
MSDLSVVKKNRRQHILDEAARLFKEKGFGGTSMRDLAEQVGMEAASMYNHIRSKDEILEQICFQVADQYIAHLTEIEQQPGTYVEKIRALLRLHVRLVIEQGDAVAVANHDWKYLTGEKRATFLEARRLYERRLAALIEEGMAQGELQPLHVSVALFTLLSAVRWVELWYRPERDISPEALEDDIVTLLMKGLEK